MKICLILCIQLTAVGRLQAILDEDVPKTCCRQLLAVANLLAFLELVELSFTHERYWL
jgi:hypothetical protein